MDAGKARASLIIGLVGAFVLMAVAIAVAVIGGEPEPTPEVGPSTAMSPSPAASASSSGARSIESALTCADLEDPVVGVHEVLVFFTCESSPTDLRAVLREGPGVAPVEDYLSTALEQLLAGPSPAEEAAGFRAPLPAEWADVPHTVDLLDGLAIIDFDRDILRLGAPNTGSQIHLVSTALTRTALQFPSVTGIELHIGGSCGAFVVWMGEISHCLVGGDPAQSSTVVEWWMLEDAVVDGERVPAVVSVLLGGDSISGFVPCSQYELELVQRDGSMTISGREVTERDCATPAESADETYLAAIPRLTAVEIVDDELLLTGPGVELRFRH